MKEKLFFINVILDSKYSKMTPKFAKQKSHWLHPSIKFANPEEKCCGNTSRTRLLFPQQFWVLPIRTFTSVTITSWNSKYRKKDFYCFYEVKAQSNFLCFHNNDLMTSWFLHISIISTSRPKLLKRLYASYSLDVGLQYWKVWKNSMRAFFNKIGLNIFHQKFKDSHYFLLIRPCHCFPDISLFW